MKEKGRKGDKRGEYLYWKRSNFKSGRSGGTFERTIEKSTKQRRLGHRVLSSQSRAVTGSQNKSSENLPREFQMDEYQCFIGRGFL